MRLKPDDLRGVSECLRLADVDYRPPRRKRRVRKGIVYFIGPAAGIVKIGFTANLDERLRRLQCGSPVPLKVIAAVEGTDQLEAEYHAQFANARQHGEWFLRTVDVEDEINRLAPQ